MTSSYFEGNIKDLYEYQIKIRNNGKEKKEYDKYTKLMEQYYRKDSIYIKEYEDGKLIFIEKTNPKHKITIEPAVFINIDVLYIELKKTLDHLYHSIFEKIDKLDMDDENSDEDSDNNSDKNSDEKSDEIEFEELQEQYKIYKDKIEDINEVEKLFLSEIITLLQLRVEKLFQLAKYYQHRKSSYHTIQMDSKLKVNENIKRNIISLFKENKCIIPTQNKINQFSKKNNIPSSHTEKWLEWIEKTYLYMKIQKEIHEMSTQIIHKEKEYKDFFDFFLIKKPIINI